MQSASQYPNKFERFSFNVSTKHLLEWKNFEKETPIRRPNRCKREFRESNYTGLIRLV